MTFDSLPHYRELRQARQADQVVNPRWLCGCGREQPIVEGRAAYPICQGCGLRMRMVTGDNLPYVDGVREAEAERG